MRGRRFITLIGSAALVAGLLTGHPAGAAQPAPHVSGLAAAPAGTQPAGLAGTAAPGLPPGDACGDQCFDILPPGTNGHASLAELIAYKTLGVRPPHNNDQLAPYENLTWGHRDLTQAKIGQFFGSSSFGVPKEQVESSHSPRPDVTIVRDKRFGIPHITGKTRYGTMYGSGYAAAQDRLFLMDVLRRVSRGKLTPFAGGAKGNQAFEQSHWRDAPYAEQDLQRQYDEFDDRFGAEGRQVQKDVKAYIDGINTYIEESKLQLWKRPGEYAALGHLNGAEPFNVRDVVATASLVGGIFGGGGGSGVESAVLLQKSIEKFGPRKGIKVWQGLRSGNDPEAPTTTRRPFRTPADKATGLALPDKGEVVPHPIVRDATTSSRSTVDVKGVEKQLAAELAQSQKVPGAGKLTGKTQKLRGIFAKGVAARNPYDQKGMSNALLVSGKNTRSGSPVAVFGPQTSYFAPQLLVLQEIQGPGISARGASFAGVSMYVQLGRGRRYAWSATSAGNDITDGYAVPLCEPGGGNPSLKSMHYKYRGKCLPVERLSHKNEWKPSLGDPTPAGSYTLDAQRTKLGLVTHRGMVKGKPVAFTKLRTTYGNEANSALGFMTLNNPSKMKSVGDFKRAAHKIGYAFNWFYADAKDAGYFNSADVPERRKGTSRDLPNKAAKSYEWRGFDPVNFRARYESARKHPQGVNERYYTSWNNKQAPGYRASDSEFGYGSVHRSQPLDDRIDKVLARGKMTRVKLIQAMEDAGTVDLRGDKLLPWMLEAIGKTGDPNVDKAVATLREWSEAGAHRRTAKQGDKAYTHAEAVKLMDAWWPRFLQAAFEPVLGADAYRALTEIIPFDDPPSAQGSAYIEGWYGYAHKDLRTLLGARVKGKYPVKFCGAGDKKKCAQALRETLTQAMATQPADLYKRPGCTDGDQYCYDQVEHQAIGGIDQPRIHWINRPTYQQVIEFPR